MRKFNKGELIEKCIRKITTEIFRSPNGQRSTPQAPSKVLSRSKLAWQFFLTNCLLLFSKSLTFLSGLLTGSIGGIFLPWPFLKEINFGRSTSVFVYTPCVQHVLSRRVFPAKIYSIFKDSSDCLDARTHLLKTAHCVALIDLGLTQTILQKM